MSYLQESLYAKERLLHRAEIHSIIFLMPLVVFALGVVVLPVQALVGWVVAVVGVVLIGDAAIRRYTTEIGVTDKRVIVKRGLIARRTDELRRESLEAISVDQGVLGRLIGFGTVIVRGTGGGLSPVKAVADPLALRTAVAHAG